MNDAQQPPAGIPVSPEILERVVSAFVTATTTAMGEWTGTDVIVGAATQRVPPEAPGTVEAWIDLAGGSLSGLMIRFPPSTAKALALRILRDVANDPDAGLVRDCLGEVANIVAGQAKALLAGTPLHFSLSPPQFDCRPICESSRCVAIRFACDVGEFSVAVFVRSEPGPLETPA